MGDLGVDQSIRLKWIFKEWDGWEGGGVAWSRLMRCSTGQVAGSCEGENEPSRSVKCGNF